MSKKYETAVFIGRFEPLHNGHISNILQSLELAQHLIIIVGSSFQPRTIKNPFIYYERECIINDTLRDMGIPNHRYTIAPAYDYAYNDTLWVQQIQGIVRDIRGTTKNAILGYEKDDSSWYLRAFPDWAFVKLKEYVNYGTTPIDATKIRELYFEGNSDFIFGAVPAVAFKFLVEFAKTDTYAELVDEYKFIKQYRKDWAVAPYPPTFFTVDAVVVQGGHVLLVRRKFAPGKGLWALPGGFLGQNETARAACIRELREETRLKVPTAVLLGSITHEQLFDCPDRSLRGRTLTQAYLIELLSGDPALPPVKGNDDAEIAKWFKISDVLEMSEQLFEDHYSIIKAMVSRAR